MIDNTEKIENCLLALMLWAEVPPEQVMLERWTCDTQACFGGHLAKWPEFQSKGVQSHPISDEPIMTGSGGMRIWFFDVAKHLFGNADMFTRRLPTEQGTDHQIIVDRLEKQIARLTAGEEA